MKKNLYCVTSPIIIFAALAMFGSYCLFVLLLFFMIFQLAWYKFNKKVANKLDKKTFLDKYSLVKIFILIFFVYYIVAYLNKFFFLDRYKDFYSTGTPIILFLLFFVVLVYGFLKNKILKNKINIFILIVVITVILSAAIVIFSKFREDGMDGFIQTNDQYYINNHLRVPMKAYPLCG